MASPPGSTGSANKEARRGKTRRRHLLCTAMALRPGLVFAEVAGSVFCPLTPSRRLRLFASPALPAADARGRARLREDMPPRPLATPRRRTVSPRVKRHVCALPSHLARIVRNARRRHRVAEVNHASDANHRAAGNASEGVGSAGPERSTDSSTVGDTSPRDAFPASSSWFAEGSLSYRLEARC
jgi:hypothetical protein